MRGMRKATFVVWAICCVLGLTVWGGWAQAQEKATLSIINFDGYSEEEWVKPFEEKYNCEVKITTAGTVEEHFTKVKAAPDEYNIVSIINLLTTSHAIIHRKLCPKNQTWC